MAGRPGRPRGGSKALPRPLRCSPRAGDGLELAHVLHMLGALLTVALGGLGLLRPAAAARRIGLEPTGRRGRSELRAVYGGLFFALGAFALAARDEVAFALVGAAWLGAAGARLGDALLVSGADRGVWRATLFEAGVATLLLVPV